MMGRSMLAYIPVNIAGLLVSFGGLAILTRLFGSDEYGRYALAMITMMAVHMGFFTWLEAAIARFEARAERQNVVNTHLKTAYVLGAITAIPVWIGLIALLCVLPIDREMKNVLIFAISSTSFTLFFNLGMEAHKAAHRIARYSAIFSANQILSFTLGIILILATPLREAAPFVGIMVATILLLILDLPFMVKRMKGGKVDMHRAKAYFAYGMPISVSLVLTYALSSGDMYIITAMLGESAAGEYSASYNLANRSLDILFVWISMAVTPMAITALEKESLEKSRQILRDYGAALLWIAMPAATGIAVVAEPAGFILGESVRAGAVQIMPLIAFAGVLNGMNSYYAQRAFMLSGKTQMFVWAMVPPVILNVVLNIIMIPKFGLMGAVYATVISYAVGLCIALIMGQRCYPLPIPYKAFFQISVMCLIMGVLVKGFPVPENTPDVIEIMIRASLGIAVYLALCYLTNTANCRAVIRSIVERALKREPESDYEVPAAEPEIAS